jgi:hypothetical protein
MNNELATTGQEHKKPMNYFQKKYYSLWIKFPTLFTSVYNDTFDKDKFQTMKDTIQKVNNGEMALEEAHEMIGKWLFTEYVEPELKKNQT